MRVGVLALQGAFAAHSDVLERLGVDAPEIRHPSDLAGLDAIVVPGGESTTMWMQLERGELLEPLGEALGGGLGLFGTCAGLILAACEVLDGRADQGSLGVIDITARRNGYGRQIASFEADTAVDGIDGGPFHAVFIRAPRVERVGPDVEVLATIDGDPVVCAAGPVMVTAFHPELTRDDRVHRLFLRRLADHAGSSAPQHSTKPQHSKNAQRSTNTGS